MKIAIIGSGIAGLTTAALLAKQHAVTVYEQASWVGGHTHTITVTEPEQQLAIDTGFIVFNEKTYPNFIKLLDTLGVAKQKTSMSFSVRADSTGLEYNGTDINGLFAQRRNLFNPKFLGLLREIVRFNKLAKQLDQYDQDWLLSDFLKAEQFSHFFQQHYLLPMCAAIWSAPIGDAYYMPIAFLFKFFNNHGMLNINDRPQWYTVVGGSHSYVHALLKRYDFDMQLNHGVQLVERHDKGVKIITEQTQAEYDRVVFACHSDQALKLIKEPTALEQEILNSFPYKNNQVILHKDTSVLPKNKRAWAAWNYWQQQQTDHSCCLSYNMNILQNLTTDNTYCVSVNQTAQLDPAKVLAKFNYAHPMYSLQGFKQQAKQTLISGKHNSFFCGAYWGNGFHEDGVASSLHIAEALGGDTL